MGTKKVLFFLATIIIQACQGGKSPDPKVEQTPISNTPVSEAETVENKIPDSIYLVTLARHIIADEWEYQGSDPRDENILPAMVYRLGTGDPEERDFWFVAVSKLLPKSDGALSEILGASIYGYVAEEPAAFFKLLAANDSAIPASMNLKEWANFVGMEIEIEYEGEEKEASKRYVQKIKKKCVKIAGAERRLLDEFVQIMQH